MRPLTLRFVCAAVAVAIAVAAGALLGCASAPGCPESIQAPPAARECHAWPHDESVRADLIEKGSRFLDELYAGRPTPEISDAVHHQGLTLIRITHAEDQWMDVERLPRDQLGALFRPGALSWLFEGMYGVRARSGIVGAAWDVEDGSRRTCVRDTEGTEGMFDGMPWVAFEPTEEEHSLGFVDGVVVVFSKDEGGQWRVFAVVKPRHGV
ncbi:MAG: hypothetical protein HOW73_04125 [Polyangiaceae bacterium]|nr:hypothetical protein [Polyangiaceae bacterium]